MKPMFAKFLMLSALVCATSQVALAEDSCFSIENPPAAYIKATKQNTSEVALTGNARITFWGDIHEDNFHTELLIKHLARLKSEGVSVLLMEMLPAGFSVSPENPQALASIQEVLDIGLKGQFPSKKYENLVRAAVAQGFTVEGFFPVNTDEQFDSPEIVALRKVRNHMYIADQYYTVNIMKILQKYPDQKVIVQVGQAHLNAYYEAGDLLTNNRMMGEFLYQGVQRSEMRILLSKSKMFANFYLPLPQGQRPGCSEFESWSSYDGIIYSW